MICKMYKPRTDVRKDIGPGNVNLGKVISNFHDKLQRDHRVLQEAGYVFWPYLPLTRSLAKMLAKRDEIKKEINIDPEVIGSLAQFYHLMKWRKELGIEDNIEESFDLWLKFEGIAPTLVPDREIIEVISNEIAMQDFDKVIVPTELFDKFRAYKSFRNSENYSVIRSSVEFSETFSKLGFRALLNYAFMHNDDYIYQLVDHFSLGFDSHGDSILEKFKLDWEEPISLSLQRSILMFERSDFRKSSMERESYDHQLYQIFQDYALFGGMQITDSVLKMHAQGTIWDMHQKLRVFSELFDDEVVYLTNLADAELDRLESIDYRKEIIDGLVAQMQDPHKFVHVDFRDIEIEDHKFVHVDIREIELE